MLYLVTKNITMHNEILKMHIVTLFISKCVVPKCIIVLFNWYRCPNIERKSFRTWFVKKPSTRLGSGFLANLDTLSSKFFSERPPSNDGGSSVSLYGTKIFSFCIQKFSRCIKRSHKMSLELKAFTSLSTIISLARPLKL